MSVIPDKWVYTYSSTIVAFVLTVPFQKKEAFKVSKLLRSVGSWFGKIKTSGKSLVGLALFVKTGFF
jgi:hypothetical protein